MKKYFLAFVIASTACVAHAQPRSFEFKGIKQTDTLAIHRTEFDHCEKYYVAQGCSPKDRVVAGVTMFEYIVLFADDGSGVSQIRGDFLGSSYDTMVQAFTMKWGKPDKTSVTVVQNGFGATLQVPTNEWDFAEGIITLSGADFKGVGRMQFLSNAEAARISALSKPKVDF
jgi:hypothetical protein